VGQDLRPQTPVYDDGSAAFALDRSDGSRGSRSPSVDQASDERVIDQRLIDRQYQDGRRTLLVGFFEAGPQRAAHPVGPRLVHDHHRVIKVALVEDLSRSCPEHHDDRVASTFCERVEASLDQSGSGELYERLRSAESPALPAGQENPCDSATHGAESLNSRMFFTSPKITTSESRVAETETFRPGPTIEHTMREKSGDEWVDVTPDVLPVAEASAWASLPDCGAVVTFCGTVRDHSEGRAGVVTLEYEIYETHAVSRMTQVAATARERFPDVRRLALLHRTGALAVGEVSVVVVASAPHRAEAFEAARFCIDTIKQTVPVWKRETWAEGSDWASCSHPIVDVADAGAE
jgi:molybdopterin synthase catalytic subunit